MQTALVMHIDSLKGVANRASFIKLAASGSENKGDAIFFAQTARILSQLQANGRTLASLETLGALPVAIGALEWDYAAWTQNAANFIAQLKTAKFGRKTPTGFVVALSGDASPLAQQKLKEAGIMLATRLAPEPLQ